jgi:hypothetical protein
MSKHNASEKYEVGKWQKKEGIEVAERLGHENSKKNHLL